MHSLPEIHPFLRQTYDYRAAERYVELPDLLMGGDHVGSEAESGKTRTCPGSKAADHPKGKKSRRGKSRRREENEALVAADSERNSARHTRGEHGTTLATDGGLGDKLRKRVKKIRLLLARSNPPDKRRTLLINSDDPMLPNQEEKDEHKLSKRSSLAENGSAAAHDTPAANRDHSIQQQEYADKIRNYLYQKEYFEACKWFHALVQKKVLEEKDIAPLYDNITSAIWSTVEHILQGTPVLPEALSSISKAIQWETETVEQHELKAEARSISKWRTRDQLVIHAEQFVKEKIPSLSDRNSDNRLEEHLAELEEIVKKLLKVTPFFKQIGCFERYVECLHGCIFYHLNKIIECKLNIHELVLIFKWVLHIYERDNCMGHSEIRHLKLESSETCTMPRYRCLAQIEGKLLTAVQAEIRGMKSSLENIDLVTMSGPNVCSNWSTISLLDIKQRVQSVIEEAQHIHKDLSAPIQDACFTELLNILKGYQKCLDDFLEHCKNTRTCKDYYLHLIKTIEGCYYLREYMCQSAQGATSSDICKEAEHVLSSVERETSKLIIQDLCNGIKPLLKKNFSNEAHDFEKIEEILMKYFASIDKEKPFIYEMLVKTVYQRVLQEYIQALLRSSVKCTSPKWMNIVDKIHNEARILQSTFRRFNPDVKLKNDALKDVAEMISLKDCEAIKLQVVILMRKYPDFREEHLRAILNIKRNISRSKRQEILKYLQYGERASDSGPDLYFF